jgi:hypothetical protein
MPWKEHFPKLRELQIMGKEADVNYISLNEARILRRSRAWNEGAAADKEILWRVNSPQDEEDEGNAVASHPTEFLQPWLKPFWE